MLYSYVKDEFAKALAEDYKLIAKPASAAMQEAANDIKTLGRADIAAAGFGGRWQKTFRVDVYPKAPRVSVNAAALVFHKIPYADVFETGATIRGKPKLWLPLSSTPKKIGRKRMTPELYRKEIGPLFSINRPGKAPLLAGKIGVSARQRSKGTTGKVTASKLRKGASGAGITSAVPLFVGVDAVTLRKRFHLRQITDSTAGRLAQLYAKHFKDE